MACIKGFVGYTSKQRLMKSFNKYFLPIVLALGFICAGCGRNTVKVYHVATDDSDTAPPPLPTTPTPASPDASAMMSPHGAAALPQIKYVLPDDWQEAQPSEIRVASFLVANPHGQPADVGVIPLPTTGQEIQLINMWRQQLQLPPTTDTNTDNVASAITVGNNPGKLFDLVSETNLIDGKARARILVAMTVQGSTSWFIKMVGEESFVEGKKDEFLKFLQSVSFSESPPPPAAMSAAAGNPTSDNKPAWSVPADWQEAPLSQFLLAKFAIHGPDHAQADVNVSQMAGEGGGLAANVNRWRHQLGLDPVDGTDLDKLVTNVSTGGTPASMVDFTGTDAKTGKKARLVGVILPLAGQTWFYKLMGDETIVAQQKDAFIKFIQSARYPDVN
jgi:hypothetical protein